MKQLFAGNPQNITMTIPIELAITEGVIILFMGLLIGAIIQVRSKIAADKYYAKRDAFYDRCMLDPFSITPEEFRQGAPLLNYGQLHRLFEHAATTLRRMAANNDHERIDSDYGKWQEWAVKVSGYIKELSNF